MQKFKIPHSVLVVVHTRDHHHILLIERARHPGFWQSVTGALDYPDEPPQQAAQREVFEETGINAPASAFHPTGVVNHYEIYPQWRDRYAPGISHNQETVFTLALENLPPITLSPSEHRAYQWLPPIAAAALCFSPSNRDAILALTSGRPPQATTAR